MNWATFASGVLLTSIVGYIAFYIYLSKMWR